MQFNNLTDFSGLAWEVVNAKNEWSVASVLRIKFKFQKSNIPNTWNLIPDDEQGELFDADEFYGEVGQSSVRYESDYVSFKPNTDVIINAHAWAPKNELNTSWDCGVRIYNEENTLLKEYGLKVKTQKKQYKVGPAWISLGRDSENAVAIRYEKAKGGTVKIPAKKEGDKDKYLKADAYNPVGCGIYKMRDPNKEQLSPQISYLGDKVKKVPAGFGFINRAWKSRYPYAGTYDQDWIDNQHPLPPHDFDPYYNQAAHPNLIMDGYLKGKVKISLSNLMYEQDEEQHIILDKYTLISKIKTHTGNIMNDMNLDTLIIDVDSENQDEWQAYASWRHLTNDAHHIEEAQTLLKNKESTDG
ncbi:DUF2169 domain-containing protein [Sulfurimonas sp. MAG313]|nr:DUF2169 domain-containing protein [Sulfurimonas sp. MAG313]MDF1880494.1 DUF2169 domain-containing protein [Sulfurimonas sp. MAG313]